MKRGDRFLIFLGEAAATTTKVYGALPMNPRDLIGIALVALAGCSRTAEPVGAGSSAPLPPPVVASSASAPSAPSTAPEAMAPVSLHFDWTPPLRASVDQRSDIRGKKVRLRYDLVVSPAPGGQHLTVAHDRVRYLEESGEIAGPESELRLAVAAIAEANIFPRMTVSKTGELVEMPSLDEEVEATVARLGRLPTAQPGDEATARKLIRDPELRASIASKVAERWTLWVEAWTSLPVPLVGPHESATEVPLPDGSKVQAPLRFAAPMPVPDLPELVRLSASSVLDGDRARDALLKVVRRVMTETSPSVDPGDYIATMRRESRMEVDTNPTTLRPHFARMTTVIRLADHKGKENVRREVHEYRFDWRASR